MNTTEEKRKNKILANIIEQGVTIHKNFGYARAAKYLYQRGLKWPVIQRIIDGNLKRRSTK